jgi:hypothetical protein
MNDAEALPSTEVDAVLADLFTVLGIGDQGRLVNSIIGEPTFLQLPPDYRGQIYKLDRAGSADLGLILYKYMLAASDPNSEMPTMCPKHVARMSTVLGEPPLLALSSRDTLFSCVHHGPDRGRSWNTGPSTAGCPQPSFTFEFQPLLLADQFRQSPPL